jgi:hypothetical protein
VTSVLIQMGHVGIERITNAGACPGRDFTSLARSTGTRGERDWNGDAAPRLARKLNDAGVGATVVDAVYNAAAYAREYDLMLSLHLQRDRDSARAFATVPSQGGQYITPDAWRRGVEWVNRFVMEYERRTTIPVTQDAITANMTDLYAWCYVQENTPAVIIECGHADIDAPVLYEPGIARVVDALAAITLAYLGVAAPAPKPMPARAPPARDRVTVIAEIRARLDELERIG